MKTRALIQIFIILMIIAYSTYHLFKGNFELSISTFPFLIVYYVFIVARQKRRD